MRQRFAESDRLRGCQYLMIERCLCHQLVRARTHISRIGERRIMNLFRGGSRFRVRAPNRSDPFGIDLSRRRSPFRINVTRNIGRIKSLFEGSSCLFSGFARRIGGSATYILTTCLTSFKKYFRVHTFYPMVRTAPLPLQHTCQLVRLSIHHPIFQVIGLVKFASICILEQVPVSQKLIFFYQSSTFSDP